MPAIGRALTRLLSVPLTTALDVRPGYGGASSSASDFIDLYSSDGQGFAAFFAKDGTNEPSVYIKDTGTPANDNDLLLSTNFDALNALFTYTAPSPKVLLQSDGDVKYSAHNLQLHSNDAASGNSNRVSITTADLANPSPDFSSADLVEQSGSTNAGYVGYISYSFSGSHRLAVRAKADTLSWIRLQLNTSSSAKTAWFNISTGVLGTVTTGATATITALSGGGYLCAIVVDEPVSFGLVYLSDADNVTTATIGNGVHLWGLQLHKSPADETYLPTTTAARYALPIEYNTSGDAIGLRVEPQATNLFLNSRAPATQGVTVTAAAHTLSFYGTGSITLSGTHSETLNGTGADDRVSTTFTPTAGTLTCTVSGTIDFVQVETGSVATSPIITAGSTVTRAADDISIATSEIPANTTVWSVYVDHTLESVVGSDAVVSVSNGATGERTEVFVSGEYRVSDGFITQAALTNVSYAADTAYKTAFTAEANDFAVSTNGTTVSTKTSGTMPTVNLLTIGKKGGAGTQITGLIRAVTYIPERVSNADLETMTT